jgi:hypothetical protein
MKKVSLRLDDELHGAIKKEAKRDGRLFGAFIARIVAMGWRLWLESKTSEGEKQ